MSGNAFVIRDGLVVNQRAFGKVRSGNDDAAGPLAVWSAGDVVRRGRGLERGDRFDRDRRFWQQGEKLGKLRLHLRDVVAEIVEDLLGGTRNIFGISF